MESVWLLGIKLLEMFLSSSFGGHTHAYLSGMELLSHRIGMLPFGRYLDFTLEVGIVLQKDPFGK